MKTPYEVLGLTENCYFKDIKQNYRKLVKKHHPDINKEPRSRKKFEAILAAYGFLTKHHIEPSKQSNQKTEAGRKEEVTPHKDGRRAEQSNSRTTPNHKTKKYVVIEEPLADAIRRWNEH